MLVRSGDRFVTAALGGTAFLVGLLSCLFLKANNCDNYVGMGLKYGVGGSECESYLSYKYNVSLLSQSSNIQLDFILLPIATYLISYLIIIIFFHIKGKYYISYKDFFSLANLVILNASYFVFLLIV
ncbi:hypothetical protein C9W97_24490 [Salmonella enterica subsp. enterica serovar Enteritidis]|nr:hypothetical protein [Salmonella enterica subsp. enterica serovar Enteritidis]